MGVDSKEGKGVFMQMYKMGSFNPNDGIPTSVTLSVIFIVLTGVALLTAFTILKTFEK
jgi:hypothetical protein